MESVYATSARGTRRITPGSLIGLEHEYVVHLAGREIDFAPLLARVTHADRPFDPPSPSAARLPAGTVVTADESEAEIALPPLPTRPGFAARLDGRAQEGRAWLRGRLQEFLGPDVALEGVSTHISVSLPGEYVTLIAEVFPSTFAPALVLLMDRQESAGILTRPHPDRLEVCGDFVAGLQLRAAAIFALGSVLASVQAFGNGTLDHLPALRLAIRRRRIDGSQPCSHWTKGAGLRREGRATPVVDSDGRVKTAQEHLEATWAAIRPALEDHVDGDELALVDRIVGGEGPLPIESAPVG